VLHLLKQLHTYTSWIRISLGVTKFIWRSVYMHASNILKPIQIIGETAQIETIRKLEIERQFYKNRNNEKFYQLIVESYLQGTHKKLSVGITDVTTDTVHAEVIQWNRWKRGLGKLLVYNTVDPKNELHIYLFGECGIKSKQNAINIFKAHNIMIFTFNKSRCEIIDVLKNESVFTLEFP
jgi:hypothetical protein